MQRLFWLNEDGQELEEAHGRQSVQTGIYLLNYWLKSGCNNWLKG